MPVGTLTFDSNNATTSMESVLRAWLTDFFPPVLASGGFVITFQQPAEPKADGSSGPLVWFQKIPSVNADPIRARDRGRTVLRENHAYIVSMVTRDRQTAVAMGDTFKRDVLASATALAVAGLRYSECTVFEDLIVDTQPQTFRRAATFKFVTEIVRG